jgi:hypothetical protein
MNADPTVMEFFPNVLFREESQAMLSRSDRIPPILVESKAQSPIARCPCTVWAFSPAVAVTRPLTLTPRHLNGLDEEYTFKQPLRKTIFCQFCHGCVCICW